MFRSKPSPSLVISVVALFVALGGTSYAALTVTGKTVRNGSLTGADIRNKSVTGADVRDGSLRAKDFRRGQLVAGAPGPAEPAGPQGPKGDTGAKGDEGEPATSLFGAVGGSGQLSATLRQGVVSAARVSTGQYKVTFDRDVTACVALANLNTQGVVAGPTPIETVARVYILGTEPNVVDIRMYRLSGGFVDADFVVAVFC